MSAFALASTSGGGPSKSSYWSRKLLSRSSFTSILRQAPSRFIATSSSKDPIVDPASTSTGPEESPPSKRLDVVDPVQTIAWGGRLLSRRRAVLGGLAGLSIGLVGNLAGVTSGLLGLDGGDLAGRLQLDVLYPVRGFKRCYDKDNSYEFVYPASWLADQRLFYRYARRIEEQNGLDPPSLARFSAESTTANEQAGTTDQINADRMKNITRVVLNLFVHKGIPQSRRSPTEPTAAYGPAGSTGELNISVVVAPILPGFRLQSLGNPSEAAQRFLDTIVAPEGSNREATLISAEERRDEAGTLYYTQEFTVKSPSFFRHNLSVYAARGTLLYTLNAQAPQSRWAETEDSFRRAAASFHLLPRPGAAFPQRI